MTAPTPNPDPEATAWQIHSALADWTGKVDAKASFVLGLETAVFAALVFLRGDTQRLAGLNNLTAGIAFAASGVLLVVSMLLTLWVVAPIVNRKAANANWNSNYIYFGHLRKWKPADLERALENEPVLPVLARQLVVMSDIAWKKHERVQWSVIAGLLGGAALIVALIFN